MKLHIVLVVTIVLITNEVSCGVIEGVYDKVSNTTQAVKEDVHSWWSYGVDTVMGDVNRDADHTTGNDGEESGIISKLYNTVKGGVGAGYRKVHDFVLGEDSDPNKGIIRTLYERAMKRLSNIKNYIFGDHHSEAQPHENEEDMKQQVLKLLFSNRTDIFNTENEKLALNSLRNKLTQIGDEVVHLTDNEKDIIRRAYESVRTKSDEVLRRASESADDVKNRINETIQQTQEFIQDESQQFRGTTQSVAQAVN